MVTASHNPVGWNGVKLGTDLSKTLLPDEIRKLYAIIEAEEYVNGEGVRRTADIREDYVKDLLSRAQISRKFKVLVNTGNGTAGIFAPTSCGEPVVMWLSASQKSTRHIELHAEHRRNSDDGRYGTRDSRSPLRHWIGI